MTDIQLEFPFMYDYKIHNPYRGIYRTSCKYHHICISMCREPLPVCSECRAYEHKRRDIDD